MLILYKPEFAEEGLHEQKRHQSAWAINDVEKSNKNNSYLLSHWCFLYVTQEWTVSHCDNSVWLTSWPQFSNTIVYEWFTSVHALIFEITLI